MNEQEILQLKLAQLESDNQSLQRELAAFFTASASNLTCDLTGNLISDLAKKGATFK